MTDWDPAAFTKALIADLREHGDRVMAVRWPVGRSSS
jgi:hypothetical protein